MDPKEALLLNLRARIVSHADRILQSPERFKVCESCDRVVDVDQPDCPACRAYRFDPSPERVRQRASFRSDSLEKFYATLPRF